jgi:hypothetical protein
MNIMHKRVAVVLLAAGLLLPAAACSSSKKTAATTTTTTTAEANKTFEVTTADGQVSVSLDGQLPPGWPKAFPIPDGATVAGSGSLVKSTSGGAVAVFTTSAKPTDTYNFYADNSSLTIESKSALGVGPAYVGTVKMGGTYAGRVTVLSKSDQTLIVIVLEAGSASTSGTDTTGSVTP